MTRKIVSEELDAEFTKFLDSKKASSRMTYKGMLAHWINFSHMNGAATLAFKKADKDAETEKLIVGFKAYLQGLKKSNGKPISGNYARTATGAVRGYLSFHRMPCQFIDSEKRMIQEASRTTEDYLFAKEDLVKMCEQANFIDRYVVLVGKSIGLRAGDFLSLTYGQFRSVNLDSEAPVSIGRIETQKEHVPAFPFLDSDTIEVVKAILKKNPDAKDEDRVLPWEELSLTHCLQRLFKNAHLVSGGKRVRFQNLRKYLIDRLSAIASESQWKQFVGKKISEDAYISQKQLQEIYKRAMPSIVINGNGKSYVKIEELETKLSEMEGQNTQLRLQLAELEKRKTLEALLEHFAEEKKAAEQIPKIHHDGKRFEREFLGPDQIGLRALLKALEKMGSEKE